MGFSLSQLVQTHAWKNFMAKLYGIGASVVIIGALFKIMHWPGAAVMLIAGLGTEAIIFFFSAFEPLHEEVDWSLVYPELAGLTDDDELEVSTSRHHSRGAISSGGEALAKFDEMLEKAGGANLFEKLGENLSSLNEKIQNMSDISDAALATNEFSEKVKQASESVTELASTYKESGETFKQSADNLHYAVDNLGDSFNKTAQHVEDANNSFVTAYEKLTQDMDVDFSALKAGNQEYNQNIETLNKNLAAINAIFEMQLNDADLDKMMEDLNSSVKYTQKYNEEVIKLGKRLEALNTVYGNMLAAMNVKVD